MQSIGHGGQPARDVFRRVDPPRAVLVDLGALFPRQPHCQWGRYHPLGLQMHKVVEGLAAGDSASREPGGVW